MGRDTMNREGLTFQEWVCAAGVASVDGHTGLVRPYTESHTVHPIRDYYKIVSAVRQLKDVPRRNTNVFYSKKIRKAWRDGEDPTEHRAAQAARLRV